MDNSPENYTMVERTNLALQCLYLNCKESQNLNRGNFAHSSQLAYAKEICTVKVATSRRSGHSSSIPKFLDHMTGKWLVLSHNLHMATRINTLCFQNINKKIIKATNSSLVLDDLEVIFGSIDQVKSGRLNGYELDGVIFDAASVLNQNKINDTYNNLMPSMIYKKYMFFIFVG